MATGHVATFEEICHWFISRPSLNLHEVGTLVATFLACLFGRVDVFPCRRTSKDIVNLFELERFLVAHFTVYFMNKWTRIASEPVTRCALLDYQNVDACGAEQKHGFIFEL